MGSIITGNTPPTDIDAYYSDSGTPWITPTDIDDNPVLSTEKYLSESGLEAARTVPAGAILCTCIASIGKNAIAQYTCGFNQQINALVPNPSKYDSYFLFAESTFWSELMKRQAAAGTMQIVNKKEFANLNTWLPTLEEQEKIGALFSRLDSLITLRQREGLTTSNYRRERGSSRLGGKMP